MSPSPDGRFALVSELHRPFSYTLPAEMFPEKTETVALKSGTVKVMFDRPLVDNLSIARDAVPAGPRDYEWRADAPATLVWVEAADGGDPAVKSEVRDRIKASGTRLYGGRRHPVGQRAPGHCVGVALDRPQGSDAGV